MARPLVVHWREAIRDTALPWPVKLTGWTLAERMTRHGFGEVSYAVLAQDASLSVRSVIRCVRRLEAAGLLSVDRATGRGNVNRYQALVPSLNGVPLSLFTPPKRRHGVTLSPVERVTPEAKKGDRESPDLEDLRKNSAREPAHAHTRAREAEAEGFGVPEHAAMAHAAAAEVRRLLGARKSGDEGGA